MLNSNKWLEDLYLEYERRFLKPPLFLSDWDSDQHELKFPTKIINDALQNTKTDFYKYSYIDSDTNEKQLIVDYMNKRANIKLSYKNISVNLNSTNSLYLALLALNNIDVKRIIVITPTYYSVLETLKQLDSHIIYYHLIDKDSFNINIKELTNLVENQFINAILMTDPVYSAGIEISSNIYTSIVELCNKHSVWFICDYTLGGMFWGNKDMFTKKLEIISQAEKYIYIESVTKKLIINGIKHSILIGTEKIISIIENLFFRISGGFCSTQIKLYEEIYKNKNEKYLNKIISKNIESIRNNYSLLKTAIQDSDFSLYNSHSGYFTIIYHKELTLEEIDIKSIVNDLLFKKNIYIYPTNILSYYHQNQFGFRINLSKKISDYIPLILECINKDFNAFYKRR